MMRTVRASITTASRYLPKKNLETLLLIGEDKFLNQQEEESYVNTKQADFLLLLIMDKENGTCQVLPAEPRYHDSD